MPHIPNALLREYLEQFRDTYLAAANRFIDEKYRERLFHYEFLKGRIVGYVDSNGGTGYEYFPDRSPGVEIRRVGARVDVGFIGIDPVRAALMTPVMLLSGGRMTFLGGGISGGPPFAFDKDAPDASILIAGATINVGGYKRKVHFAEIYARTDQEFWSVENAVRRANDEILFALTEIRQFERENLPFEDYIAHFKRRTVLVLGDYGTGFPDMEAIVATLLSKDYRPILLKDIPDYPGYDLMQKFTALASVVRFLVFEDSHSSGHLSEFERTKQNGWITIVLRKSGKQSTYMTSGASLVSTVIKELTYEEGDLPGVLASGIQWAESRLGELETGWKELYPWR